jgi:hypothetical protein
MDNPAYNSAILARRSQLHERILGTEQQMLLQMYHIYQMIRHRTPTQLQGLKTRLIPPDTPENNPAIYPDAGKPSN